MEAHFGKYRYQKIGSDSNDYRKIQKRGVRVPDNEYPVILGWDIAGTVAQVGKNVTRFKVGDRVVAAAASISTPGERFGGFQEYTLVSERGAAKLPQSFSFDDGATLPLAFSTAATGLYKDQGLPLPELETKPGSAGKTALVWGGSSSVGALAVQLLRYVRLIFIGVDVELDRADTRYWQQQVRRIMTM